MDYLWLKALHIISVIAWMAGILYLPRLFVYHVGAPKASPLSETFKVMERRLSRVIMTPAMVLTFASGAGLLALNPALLSSGAVHFKLLLVFMMAGVHGFLLGCLRAFAEDRNKRSARFFRILNEVPTALMIGIVILIVVKPF